MNAKFLLCVLLFLQASKPDRVLITKQLIEAFNKSDDEKIKSLLHPLCIFTTTEGADYEKREIIDVYNDETGKFKLNEEIVNIKEVKNEVWTTLEIKGEYLTNIDAKYPTIVSKHKFLKDRIIRIKNDTFPGYKIEMNNLRVKQSKFNFWHRRIYNTKVPDSLIIERSREYLLFREKNK